MEAALPSDGTRRWCVDRRLRGCGDRTLRWRHDRALLCARGSRRRDRDGQCQNGEATAGDAHAVLGRARNALRAGPS